jgi:hypothetical protein
MDNPLRLRNLLLRIARQPHIENALVARLLGIYVNPREPVSDGVFATPFLWRAFPARLIRHTSSTHPKQPQQLANSTWRVRRKSVANATHFFQSGIIR